MSQSASSIAQRPPNATPGHRAAAAAIFYKTFTETYFLTVCFWIAILLWASEEIYSASASPSHYSRAGNALYDMFYIAMAYIGSALMGFLFGIVQFRSLNRFDQWALLVHRPISRTSLFFIMARVGLFFYVVTIAVPMCVFLAWALPNVATAPTFHLEFVYPYAAGALTGVPLYFIGALIVQRQARWFATRFVPFFGGVVVLALAAGLREFSAVVVMDLLATATFALAAWGSTISQGRDRPVPPAARLGLWTSLFAGCLFFGHYLGAISLAALLSHAVAVHPAPRGFPDLSKPQTSATPTPLANGQIGIRLRTTLWHQNPTRVEVLDDRFVTIADQLLPDAIPLTLPYSTIFYERPPANPVAHDNLNFGVLVSPEPWPRQYEDTPPPPHQPLWKNLYLSSPQAPPTADQSIGNVCLLDRRLQLTNFKDDRLAVTLPLSHPFPMYDVTVAVDSNWRFIVVHYRKWGGNNPSTALHSLAGRPFRDEYFEMYDRSGTLTAAADFDSFDPIFVKYTPDLRAEKQREEALRPYRFAAGITNALGMSTNALPLQRWTVLPTVNAEAQSLYWDIDALRATVVTNLLTAAAVVLLARAYRLTWPITAVWMLTALILGPLTLLIFVSFHALPARVPCPHCHKRRPVNDPLCPRCSARFPLPAPNGTEILAHAGLAQSAAASPETQASISRGEP